MPDTRWTSEAPAGVRTDTGPHARTLPTTGQLVDAVRAHAACGGSLDEVVRDVVQPAGVDDEVRSALWLIAWVRCDRTARPPPRLARLTDVPAG